MEDNTFNFYSFNLLDIPVLIIKNHEIIFKNKKAERKLSIYLNNNLIDSIYDNKNKKSFIFKIKKNNQTKTYKVLVKKKKNFKILQFIEYDEVINLTNKLKETKETFYSLYNSSIDAIYIQDFNSKFIDVNKAAIKMYKYPKSYFVGKDPSILSAEGKNNLNDLNNSIQKAIKGKPQKFYFWGIDKNRKIFPKIVRINRGKFFGKDVLYAFSLDISTIKKQEEELKKRELQYKTMIEKNPAGIVVHTNGKIIYVNKTAKKIFKLKNKKDYIGQDVLNFIHPLFRKIVLKRFTQTNNKRIYTEAIYEKLLTKTGDIIYALVSSFPIMYNNKPSTMVVIIDMTKQKKIDEEKKEIEKKKQYIKQLENIGILAGGIAHDFNNILAAILSNITLCKLKLSKSMDIEDNLNKLQKSIEQAQKLTQQLLTFSKGGAPIKETASVIDIIKDSINFVLSGSNVTYKISNTQNLWNIKVDKSQISQVIQNLIINAKEAMPNGGVINIKIENFNNKNHIIPIRNGNYIKISISDTGVGIPEENLSKIFTPFFTTKKKGSGLGLAIVYSIIKKHKGYINVISNPNEGTTFEIYLPASNEKIKKMPQTKQSLSLNNFKGNILIMDDNPDILETLKELLTLMGFEVLLAKNGDEAIEIYKKYKDKISIVILDLTIPGGKSGIETFNELKKIYPHITAVISTGYINDLNLINYKQLGFKGILKKPYTYNELVDILSKLMK